jgi:hypothetical protein
MNKTLQYVLLDILYIEGINTNKNVSNAIYKIGKI